MAFRGEAGSCLGFLMVEGVRLPFDQVQQSRQYRGPSGEPSTNRLGNAGKSALSRHSVGTALLLLAIWASALVAILGIES